MFMFQMGLENISCTVFLGPSYLHNLNERENVTLNVLHQLYIKMTL